MLMLLRTLHIWKKYVLHWHKLCQPLQSQNWVTQKSWCMLHVTFSDVFRVYLYSKWSYVHKNLQSAQICMCNTKNILNNALSYVWKFTKKPVCTNTIKTNWWKLQKKTKSKPFCYSESKSSDVVVGRGTQEHLFRLHILMRTTAQRALLVGGYMSKWWWTIDLDWQADWSMRLLHFPNGTRLTAVLCCCCIIGKYVGEKDRPADSSPSARGIGCW